MNDTTTQSPAQRPDAATYMSLFEDDATRCAPGALMANNSRMAYLVHLKELILALEAGADVSAPLSLATRRPDLLALTLDERAARKALPKIRRVLNLLERCAQEALSDGQSLQAAVAKGSYRANVPFHHAWESIKATLAIQALSPWEVLTAAHIDQPLFAFDNLTKPDHRAATALCAGGSPQLQALLREGNSGLKLASVTTTRQLASALGTTRRELRRLLAVDAVGVEGTSVIRSTHVPSAAVASGQVYGAAFVNAQATPLYLSKPDAQTSGKPTVGIEGLTQAHLDRLYGALRVQRALDLSAAETDVLLMAAMRAEGQTGNYRLTDHTLRALGLFQHLRATRRVTAWQFAALLDEVSPYAVKGQTPFYDSLFVPVANDEDTGTEPVLTLDGGAFDPLASGGEDGSTLKQLALGLKVDEAQLRVILAWVTKAQGLDQPTRSLAVVSACYRITKLARLFRTSTRDGLTLLELLMGEQSAYLQQLAGIPRLGTTAQADIVDVIGTVAQAMGWMRQQGLTAE
nr:Tc toxin subunit A [uncultured Pseudomonas sp.]